MQSANVRGAIRAIGNVRCRLCSTRTQVPVVGAEVPVGEEANQPKSGKFDKRHEEASTAHYDIVINGGGVVGFSLLAALNESPYFKDRKMLLLEQQPEKPKMSEELKDQPSATERKLSNRVSSLTTASKKFFNDVGVWPHIEPLTKQATSMHVWSHDYSDGITFSPRFPGLSDSLWNARDPTTDDCICYFVENHVLLNALEARVPHQQIRYGSSVTDITANDRQVDVIIGEDNKRITTNLLVGCDGFNSITRRKSNLKYFENHLKEKGIVGTVEMLKDSEYDQNEVAFQRFYPEDGTVIALLPLTENYSSFVISAPNKRADHLMQLSDEEFVQAINDLLVSRPIEKGQLTSVARVIDDTFKNLLKSANLTKSLPPKLNAPQVLSVIPKSRASFPLAFATTVPSLVGSPKGSKNNKVVIIGDSSHRIQPLAGQGLNLGIGDSVELAESLEEPLRRGDDIFSGSFEADEALTRSLFEFERRRQFKLIPMMATVAFMQSTFSFLPSSLLSSLNGFGLLKNEIVKFANSR